MSGRTYIAIDLKSFYASVECIERCLDPLKTNLVVADASRTEKTICLAVSPALKAYGIPGRARLFEVNQKVKEVNAERRKNAPNRTFTGKSFFDNELKKDASLKLDFIIAPPQMAKYMEVSSGIYSIYLKYISPQDIHVYSIDEVFIDATNYLKTYKMSANELAMTMINDVLKNTGITATAGIGTNLYLAKIAMDIDAKRMKPNKDGVRIAELSERTYRERLWTHRPLTDFWRIGKGYASKLEANGIYTMGDVARCSVGGKYDRLNEELLYKLFGVNAELLIDHAWGREPCTIAEIKAYTPENTSISSGQVLSCAYEYNKAKLVLKEMTDSLTLDLVDKKVVTDQIVLTVCYDTESAHGYGGEITEDRYGRKVPKSAHGSINLPSKTSSSKIILKYTEELFERIVDKKLLVRRIYVVANHITGEEAAKKEIRYEQLDLFTDLTQLAKKEKKEKEELRRERAQQETIIKIKKKYGKNAILKGMNFEDGATAKQRNEQVGGHKA